MITNDHYLRSLVRHIHQHRILTEQAREAGDIGVSQRLESAANEMLRAVGQRVQAIAGGRP